MQLHSLVTPAFFPPEKQTTVLLLGIQPLPLPTWLVMDDDWPQFYQHKQTVKQQAADKVFFVSPQAMPAISELTRLIKLFHTANNPGRVSIDADRFEYLPNHSVFTVPDDDLWQSTLMLQEDVCVLQPVNNNYVLTAASVCSPSNWRLEEKKNKTLDIIHAPVPGYQQQLSARVNKLFSNLKADKPLLRYNWSLQQGCELGWRDDGALTTCPGHTETKNDDETNLYWRVERQTLRRLPDSGAIIFGIRIFIHSLTQVLNNHQRAKNFHCLLSQLPAAEQSYKGLHRLKAILDREVAAE